MRTRSLPLDDFELSGAGSYSMKDPLDGHDREAERLSAFEKGYKAGWDDSVNTISTDDKIATTELLGNLSDLSFTFHEARNHVLTGLKELVSTTFSQFLPTVSKRTFIPMIWEQIEGLAEASASQPVVLLVAPDSRQRLEGLLSEISTFPLSIREESTLVEGQVFIRMGDKETSVDFNAAKAEIEKAADDFFANEMKEEIGEQLG